jgi:hypothetical protein
VIQEIALAKAAAKVLFPNFVYLTILGLDERKNTVVRQ